MNNQEYKEIQDRITSQKIQYNIKKVKFD